MAESTEKQAFAARLRLALEALGVRPSPTKVAHEFNLRHWGRSITPHTARNWLLGNAIPTQEKLRVLADWLQVSPDELRFGLSPGPLRVAESLPDAQGMDLADREMLKRYLQLPPEDRKVIRHTVMAFSQAASLKKPSA